MNQPVRLTQMVECAGCAAKLGPAQLSRAVAGLADSLAPNPDVLIGFETLDDAGVFRIAPGKALVQTIDFITPLVDDPFTYGAIAVTNALSDVYAMGGEPITALNVVCFPGDGDADILRQILLGGLSKLTEARVCLLGGHSVDDREIKYGASITGIVNPARLLTNKGARIGDRLILTKALGVGIATTAIKQGRTSTETQDAAVQSMTTLNQAASRLISEHGANACTDVTGFSLMGHLHHMTVASNVSAVIGLAGVPVLPGVLDLAAAGIYPGGSDRNRAHFGAGVALPPDLEPEWTRVLFDPQTSGGLLASVPESTASDLVEALRRIGAPAAVVGTMEPKGNSEIRVEA